jgi:hypothetical protein
MIDKQYRQSALAIYGESCEICGHRTSLEVHHINYQEHQELEDTLRYQQKNNLLTEFAKTLFEAKAMNFDEWNPKTNQLSKDDATKNLSVLCGNCHGLVHIINMGMKMTRAIKPRF